MSLTSWWWIWQHVRRWGWREVNQFLKIYALWIQYNKSRVLSIWQATPVLPATPSLPIAGTRVSGWWLRSRNLLLPTRKQNGVETKWRVFDITKLALTLANLCYDSEIQYQRKLFRLGKKFYSIEILSICFTGQTEKHFQLERFLSNSPVQPLVFKDNMTSLFRYCLLKYSDFHI